MNFFVDITLRSIPPRAGRFVASFASFEAFLKAEGYSFALRRWRFSGQSMRTYTVVCATRYDAFKLRALLTRLWQPFFPTPLHVTCRLWENS